MKKLSEMTKYEFILAFNEAKEMQFVAVNIFKGVTTKGRKYVGFIGSFLDTSIIDRWFTNDRDSMGYVLEIDAIII